MWKFVQLPHGFKVWGVMFTGSVARPPLETVTVRTKGGADRSVQLTEWLYSVGDKHVFSIAPRKQDDAAIAA